jgi:hypothetical protein
VERAYPSSVAFAVWAQLNGPYWNLWNPKLINAVVSPKDPAKVRYVIDNANRVVIA